MTSRFQIFSGEGGMPIRDLKQNTRKTASVLDYIETNKV